MLRRVPQPAINPALRDPEQHRFWPGFVVVMLGVALLVCGARHVTGLGTVDGSTASEAQLIKAFSSAGLQYADRLAPVPPPSGDDPEALDRWARQMAQTSAPTWQVRIDTSAKAACPT